MKMSEEKITFPGDDDPAPQPPYEPFSDHWEIDLFPPEDGRRSFQGGELVLSVPCAFETIQGMEEDSRVLYVGVRDILTECLGIANDNSDGLRATAAVLREFADKFEKRADELGVQ